MSDFIFKQLINGEWVDASNGGTWPLLNPATEEVLLDIPFGNASDATAAIDAAAAAFPPFAELCVAASLAYLTFVAAYAVCLAIISFCTAYHQ